MYVLKNEANHGNPADRFAPADFSLHLSNNNQQR